MRLVLWFFFSSRRRHTRSDRDWSSDVCSSDLPELEGLIQVWVHDQDEALEFWTKKIGWEVRSDITMEELGDFRWLTVGAPGQDFSLALMAIPGPPVMDEETKKQVEDLMSKGFAGTVFLTADDVQA